MRLTCTGMGTRRSLVLMLKNVSQPTSAPAARCPSQGPLPGVAMPSRATTPSSQPTMYSAGHAWWRFRKPPSGHHEIPELKMQTSRAQRWVCRVTTASSALLLAGCVQWEQLPVTPSPSLPRWVEVTTRDSSRYLLRDAGFAAGDTLVGWSHDDARGDVALRIPRADIVALEGRVPSVSRTVEFTTLFLLALSGFVYLVGHAGSTGG